jgi:GrpB-like predicted nucleotidyltransferase (UPF0157 family)
MKNTQKKSIGYFNRFDENPIELKPYDPSLTPIALELVDKLIERLINIPVEILHIGSSAYEISGKGVIEIAILSGDDEWEKIKKRLFPVYGKPKFELAERVGYNTQFKWKAVEILLMRGDTAKLNKAVHTALKGNTSKLQEYEAIKEASKHSNREYHIAKNKFFENIIEALPEK